MSAYPWFLLFAACPGGPDTPCNNRGVCLDQYWSTGECKCNTGFNGTACELCWPGRFGPDCQRTWHPPCPRLAPRLAPALPLPCPCPAHAPSPLCLWCTTIPTQLLAPLCQNPSTMAKQVFETGAGCVALAPECHTTHSLQGPRWDSNP